MLFQKVLDFGNIWLIKGGWWLIGNFSEGLHLKMYLIRDKRDVCKVAGKVFRWLQDADNLKYIVDHIQVQDHHFCATNGHLDDFFFNF